ncbi:Cell division protein FtsI [Clostridiaceae bacterium JG1575]|nr:Cell division protein FtsI [Clostridiaceae bacterium JG1575]
MTDPKIPGCFLMGLASGVVFLQKLFGIFVRYFMKHQDPHTREEENKVLHLASRKKKNREGRVDPRQAWAKMKEAPAASRMAFFVALIFLILSLYLSHVMIVKAKTNRVLAEDQLRHTVTLPPRRGNILDRNGNLLAANIASFQIDMDARAMQKQALKREQVGTLTPKDEEVLGAYVAKTAKELSSLLSLDETVLREKLLAKDRKGNYLPYVEIGTKQDIEHLNPLKEYLKKEKISWMVLAENTRRYYPNQNMLAQTLGILDAQDVGRFGLEKEYNEALRGVPGLRISQINQWKEDLGFQKPILTPPVDGADLVTTIDERIQIIARDAALKAMKEHKAKGVHILVSNPLNGEILAMVTTPDFDLNRPYVSEDTKDLLDRWRNKAVVDLYEPGSTFKIVTMAAALSEGVVSDKDVFTCHGHTEVDGIAIHCPKPEGHGDQNYFQIFGNSCNVGFIELGKRLGRDKLEKWTKKFGLGSALGIDLPQEGTGSMDFKSDPTAYDLANKSFGQATLTTSLQLLNDINIVMNKGKRTTPHLMKELRRTDAQGKISVVSTYKEKETEDVLDDKVADTLIAMMEETVAHSMGHRAQVQGVRVVGKTGTAQKINPKTGKYENIVATFVGAAPADQPKLSVFVAIDEPESTETSGGMIAAPVVQEIISQSLCFLK